MGFVYTIQHPLTDEIVYVGCTKDINTRIKSHIQCRKENTNITRYINDLRKNYLYPKILVIEEVEDNEMFFCEMFWIRMLRSWGFNLLNHFKLTPPIKPQYLSVKSSYTGAIKERKSRHWNEEMFFVGNTLYLDGFDKRSFTNGFKFYCRKFNVKLYLKYSKDNLSATIVDVKPKVEVITKNFIWPKGKDRKQRDGGGREIYAPLREVGGSVIYKPTSFDNMKNRISFLLKDIKPKRMNYEILNDGFIKATRIY